MAAQDPEGASEPIQSAAPGDFRQATDAAAQPARLRLEELLAELMQRAGDVLETQGRLRGLLDAVVYIAESTSVRDVLTRLVEAARHLVNARYCALGIIAPTNDRLDDFITSGLSDDEIAAIGALPAGKGLLGALITDPRPIRLGSIAADPRAVGFPANHPPMTSFLGAPLRVRDSVFGNLYLADRMDGQPFSDEDEQLAVALAAAGSTAIRNAQLFDEQQLRERWTAATANVSIASLQNTPQQELFDLIARSALRAATAERSLVLGVEGERLRVVAGSGRGTDDLVGRVIPLAGTLAHDVIVAGQPMAADGLDGGSRLSRFEGEDMELARIVIAPISAENVSATPTAVLLLGFEHGASSRLEQLEPMTAFARQASVALNLSRAQAEQARLAILEDRDRIARDLHDLVIQRLFATGMTLQSAARLIDDTEAGRRVDAAVDDLDMTIKEVRQAIYQLQGQQLSGSLRAAVQEVLAETVGDTDLTVRTQISGVLDSLPRDKTVEHLMAVLREALTNVVRHAQATEVAVAISVGEGCLSVTVADNGRGVDPSVTRRSGLANLESRSHELGGDLAVASPQSGGTQLTWRVPLS